MEHLDDRVILELLTLGPKADKGLLAHLGECDQCRRRFEQLAEIHSLLGQWQLPLAQVDLADKIVQQARQTPRVSRGLAFAFPLGRAAAAIIAAAAIGYTSGWLTHPSQKPLPAVPVAATEADVSELLHLDVLSYMPVGLSDSLDQLGANPQETGK